MWLNQPTHARSMGKQSNVIYLLTRFFTVAHAISFAAP